MRFSASRFAFFFLFSLLAASFLSAQSPLTLDENSLTFHAQGPALSANLPLNNSSRQPLPVHILIVLLNTSGSVESQFSQDTTLPPGPKKLILAFPPIVTKDPDADLSQYLWYRFRYTITPADPSLPPTHGIVAVGNSAPDFFELHVAGPPQTKLGGHYSVHVRAIHPFTGRPVAGVTIRADIDLDTDDDAHLTTKSPLTDRRGFAVLDFTLPAKLEATNLDLTVTGKLANFSANASGSFLVNSFPRISLSTDKSLYQPGQTLHVRALAFDSNKKALANHSYTLKVLDPDGTLIYLTPIKTSRFGISSADWQIPDNLRLGDYEIALTPEGDSDRIANTSVKISRYELPTFSVTATPDRPFYLPSQNATVDVHADYLFGEPVRAGHVRVVRETAHIWNFREQKFDNTEGQVYEGTTDSRGHFTANIDLSADFAGFPKNDYQRFLDLTLAAYFTDPSTGRTEQRRFDLRVTPSPIHVYVLGAATQERSGKSSLSFYLSTSSADGSPISCDVDISGASSSPSKPPSLDATAQLLRHVHTNRYGLAKVSDLLLPAPGAFSENVLNFLAHDNAGNSGQHSESIHSNDDSLIRLETDKSIYRPGEPVRVQLVTSDPAMRIVLDVFHDSLLLYSQALAISGSTADVELPGNPAFQNEVNIVAYSFGLSPGRHSGSSVASASRTVSSPKIVTSTSIFISPNPLCVPANKPTPLSASPPPMAVAPNPH